MRQCSSALRCPHIRWAGSMHATCPYRDAPNVPHNAGPRTVPHDGGPRTIIAVANFFMWPPLTYACMAQGGQLVAGACVRRPRACLLGARACAWPRGSFERGTRMCEWRLADGLQTVSQRSGMRSGGAIVCVCESRINPRPRYLARYYSLSPLSSLFSSFCPLVRPKPA